MRAPADADADIEDLELEDCISVSPAVVKKAYPPSLDDVGPRLASKVRAACNKDDFLSDVVEVKISEVGVPAAVTPFNAFDYHLYRSPAATAALRSVLSCVVPGTSHSFEEVLQAIDRGSLAKPFDKNHPQRNYCYLRGGQVRDVLQGQLSKDIDFNFSCDAQEVALVTVAHGWPTKYKAIGDGISVPNYVLVGDDNTDNYLEGFCIDFDATKACYCNDLTMNILLYDLTNDIIIDKCTGVADIKKHTLRITVAEGESFESWAIENFTPGNKELRYIKFLLRAAAKGKPLSYDAAECAFIVKSLRSALKTNAETLGAFWLGYTLKANMQDELGVYQLRDWVEKHGGPTWWEEQWAPLVRRCVRPCALPAVDQPATEPLQVSPSLVSLPTTAKAPPKSSAKPPGRGGFWTCRCIRQTRVEDFHDDG